MPTYKRGKNSSGKAAAKTSKGSAAGGGRKKRVAPSTDPIIITGGSLLLEYADRGTDGFDPDTASAGRKRLKHKGNGGRVELTTIAVYSPAPNPNTPTSALPPPIAFIDLRTLNIHGRCQIRVEYDR